MRRNKGGNNPFLSQPPQANVAQAATSSASQAPEKQETAHAEESWSYDYDTYWTDDWSGYESYYGYDGDYSQGDWYNWSYFASTEELTESEDKHSDVIFEDGQTDKINRFCFSGIPLVPIVRTRTCRGPHICASVRVCECTSAFLI